MTKIVHHVCGNGQSLTTPFHYPPPLFSFFQMKMLSVMLFWAIKISTAVLTFIAELCDSTVRFDNEKFAVFSYKPDDCMNACRGLLVHLALRIWYRNAAIVFLVKDSTLRFMLDDLLGEPVHRIKFYYSIRPMLDDIHKIRRLIFSPIFIFTNDKRWADRLHQIANMGLPFDTYVRYFRSTDELSEFPYGNVTVWHLFLDEYTQSELEKNLWWIKQCLCIHTENTL